MALTVLALAKFLDEYLQVGQFNDYCPNGLQVEASEKIEKVVTGVTASQALIDRAIELKADAILVHHGYFWKGENAAITGIKAKRIQSLMNNGISLLAYHLPLDAHPELGNNAQLAKLLGFAVEAGLDSSEFPVGNIGSVNEPVDLLALGGQIEQLLGREPLLIGDVTRVVKRVAWCTGAAQSYIDKAADLGVDCFISGEISEPTVHIARERGIAYIAAGHHATERYGIKALGEMLADKYSIDVEFVDIDNPV
jgi:dinuclear metal center YbgI/SA1388 family protein